VKPLIKYALTLFILIQVGYTQVFAHLYRGTTFNCALKTIRGTGHDQSVVIKATELEDIYVEEEDKEEKEEEERISSREFSKDNACVFLFFIHEHEYFFQRIKAYSSSFSFLSHLSFFKSSHLSFRVLRI
jgi:hypothetical protein